MFFDTDSSCSSTDSFDDAINDANRGYPDAQYNVGIYFHSGFEVPRCYTRALHFFVLAARQGHAKAMHMIGVCYKFGEGVPLDNHFAFKWFIFSSARGNHLANYEIGFMYYHGYGTEQNYHLARDYLRIGIEKGDKHGILLYEETLKKIEHL